MTEGKYLLETSSLCHCQLGDRGQPDEPPSHSSTKDNNNNNSNNNNNNNIGVISYGYEQENLLALCLCEW